MNSSGVFKGLLPWFAAGVIVASGTIVGGYASDKLRIGRMNSTAVELTVVTRELANSLQSELRLTEEASRGVANTLALSTSTPAAALAAAAQGVFERHPQLLRLSVAARQAPSASSTPRTRDGTGQLQPSANQGEAVLLVTAINPGAPASANALRLLKNLDLYSEPSLQRAIAAVRLSGNGQLAVKGLLKDASTFVLPVQPGKDSAALLLADVSLPRALEKTLQGASKEIKLRVLDVSDKSAERLVYPTDKLALDSQSVTAQMRRSTTRVPFVAMGRPFELESVPNAGFLQAQASDLPTTVLIGSIAFSALLAAFVFLLMTRNRRISAVVDQRTDELSEMNVHLRESEMMAMQAEKMSSLGQMVAGVAHEINTPLGFVSSNVQMMSEVISEFSASSERQTLLLARLAEWNDMSVADRNEWFQAAMAQMAALKEDQNRGVLADADSIVSDSLVGLERLADLVSTLKNFSRVDRAMIENIDIHDCIESTLKIAHNNTKHKADVLRDFAELPRLTVNPSQINQVLLNLINNAAQAIVEFGQITISTRDDGGYIKVVVMDTGQGIDNETQKKIFEPFFTTKAMGEGTGLGLSISQKIAKEHGGWLEVHSAPGEGSEFSLVLPVVRVEVLG